MGHLFGADLEHSSLFKRKNWEKAWVTKNLILSKVSFLNRVVYEHVILAEIFIGVFSYNIEQSLYLSSL